MRFYLTLLLIIHNCSHLFHRVHFFYVREHKEKQNEKEKK